MNRSRIHVLIVEDDQTQGKALHAAFARAGYDAHLADSSAKALGHAYIKEIHCLIVDCMLPKMNGIDLVEELLRMNKRKPKVFMFSGIFRDKGFIKEAIERTGCVEFFSKPLDIREELVDDEPAVVKLYQNARFKDEQLESLIREESSIHAFHLPALLSHLQNSLLSGELNVIAPGSLLSTISLHQGRVFSVRTPDKETFFGSLAVSFGFADPDDVMAALNSQNAKMLGQIQDHVVSLDWVERRFSAPEVELAPERYHELTRQWVLSKINDKWLKSTFNNWGSYILEGSQENLNRLTSEPGFDRVNGLRHMFRDLLGRKLFLGKLDDSTGTLDFMEARLDKILEEHKTQDLFQVLNLSQQAKGSEIRKSYETLQGFFDPARLAPGCPAAITIKCTQVHQKIQEAFDTLSDDEKRGDYLESLNRERSRRLMEAEPTFRSAIIELQAGQAAQAAVKLQNLIDNKLEFRDLRALRIWAGLRVDRLYSEITLDQVPPEERHSAAYMMAVGVDLRNKGQLKKALHSFRTAHALDPDFRIAKFEIQDLAATLERKGERTQILKDATSIVHNLFGKSTKSGKRGA